MRTMVRIEVPVEAGNRGIRSGRLPQLMQEQLDKWKPEAAYFTTHHGMRTAYIFLDLPDQSMLPQLAEPFFLELDAKVEFMPAMNREDLRKGLSGLSMK